MDSADMLKTIVLEQKKRRQATLDKLPEQYAPLIKDVLTHMDDYKLNEQQVQKKIQKLSELRASLNKEDQISQSVSRDIFFCLDEIDDKVRAREKFYYLHKILVRTSFHRFKVLVFHPHLFSIPSLIESIGNNAKYFVDSLHPLSTEELKTLYNFGGKSGKTLDIVAPVVESTLQKILAMKNVPNYSSQIDQETKNEIIRVAQEQFPNVGNNKRMFFERPNQTKELDAQFDVYIGGLIIDYVLDYLSYNLESYPSSTALFYDFFIIVSIILREKELENIYVPFAQDYVNKVFARTHESKLTVSRSQNADLPTGNNETLNQSVQKFFPRKSINGDVLAVINAFLQEIGVNTQQEKEIRKLFLRRYRSKIEIRLHDLEEKYALHLDTLSPDLLHMLKEVGFIITQEKKIEHSVVKDVPKTQDIVSLDVPQEIQVITPWFDILLDTIESLDWKEVITVLERYGYIVDNPKRFIKQLSYLYITSQQKTDFLVSLKNNIQQAEKRIGRNFWAIELKNAHRILILEKNIIDGIYLHDQYDTRIKSLFK